jgi:hypothetical protein
MFAFFRWRQRHASAPPGSASHRAPADWAGDARPGVLQSAGAVLQSEGTLADFMRQQTAAGEAGSLGGSAGRHDGPGPAAGLGTAGHLGHMPSALSAYDRPSHVSHTSQLAPVIESTSSNGMSSPPQTSTEQQQQQQQQQQSPQQGLSDDRLDKHSSLFPWGQLLAQKLSAVRMSRATSELPPGAPQQQQQQGSTSAGTDQENTGQPAPGEKSA